MDDGFNDAYLLQPKDFQILFEETSTTFKNFTQILLKSYDHLLSIFPKINILLN